jgi:XTP/dITP diphosphohydrolase
MKKILIGTHNKGKFREIAYLISNNIKKISPYSLKIKSPKETGKTFASNSKLKVNFFSKFVNYPVISDDSGLCVKALNNKPGIHSARLANKKGGFLQAMKFILKKLEAKKNRSAFFVCNLSYKNSEGKIISVEGKIRGKISKKIIGKKGFGYDPIFIPNNRNITFGQMTKSTKIKIDHRFKAFKKLKKKVKIL